MEIPEAIIAGSLSNFISERSRAHLLPGSLTLKDISLTKSYNNFLSDKLARSTLYLLFLIILKRSPFNSIILLVSRKVNKLLYNVTGMLCTSKSLTLFEFDSFTGLN